MSVVLTLLLALGTAVEAAIPDIQDIVPGVRMGEVGLGMTPAQVKTAQTRTRCEVEAEFENGSAIRLDTNCGGALQAKGGIQVGLQGFRVLFVYGPPDISIRETVSAEWWWYRIGIGFRIVKTPDGTLIQRIAVVPRRVP